MNIVIPISGGIDSGYLMAKAVNDGHTVHPVEFDDGDMTHPETVAARELVDYYRARARNGAFGNGEVRPMTSLRIPELPLLKVRYPVDAHSSMQLAMTQTDYWSGYKALFYATSLAFGGAIGADRIEFGVYEWNDHFVDELPESARAFRDVWIKLYPELRVPTIEFPLVGEDKALVLRRARALCFPFAITWSCFRAGETHCGECLGCQHRRSEFRRANLIDPVVYNNTIVESAQ